MASSLTLKVGNFTSPITFVKTDVEVAQVLRYFLADKAEAPPEGLTQAQQNQWYLDYAAAELVRYVRREAQRNRLRQLREEQASLDDRATQDTAI